MVEPWLVDAAVAYNRQSFEQKDGYVGLILLPIKHLETVLNWSFQSLPDEILVGFDPNQNLPHNQEIHDFFIGSDHREELHQGEGLVLGEPHLVNRGDSFSVHHIPEEWVDEIFAQERGGRGSRFTHWLHTHPNAVAIPSNADADAAQWTSGVDMILGIQFSPSGPLPWFDEVDGVRRPLQPEEAAQRADVVDSSGRRGWARFRRSRDEKQILGRATTGHRIHGLELISFHRTGVGINVVLVDEEGVPIGWDELK
ncbi:MAG: hypothetical protein VYB83_01005 [Candidatus Thermoplasmatota archaeon]|nr:hypothetical protein [Candidatus Thermoplasmatota archaeon]